MEHCTIYSIKFDTFFLFRRRSQLPWQRTNCYCRRAFSHELFIGFLWSLGSRDRMARLWRKHHHWRQRHHIRPGELLGRVHPHSRGRRQGADMHRHNASTSWWRPSWWWPWNSPQQKCSRLQHAAVHSHLASITWAIFLISLRFS